MTTFKVKNVLTFLPPLRRQACLCVLNNCYHVAVSVFPFNFICNMTIFRKSLILASPHPYIYPGDRTKVIQSKIKSDLFNSNCFFLSAYKVSVNIDNWQNVFDLWPCLKSQGGEYFYILWRYTYLQALGNLKVARYIIALVKCVCHFSKKAITSFA